MNKPHPMELNEPMELSEPMGECPSCRTRNDYHTVECTACGARLPWASSLIAAPDADAAAAESKTNRTVLWVFGGLGTISILIGFLLLLATVLSSR